MSIYKRPLFITFEGVDGSGKTTQSKKLYQSLIDIGEKVIYTREPGGTPEAEKIREDLLSGKYESGGPTVEALMFNVARLYHMQDLIAPSLQNGCTVICDRFADSTIAYQTASAIISNDMSVDAELREHYFTAIIGQFISLTNAIVTRKPDVTVYLDMPVDAIAERLKDRNKDRFEKEDVTFRTWVKKAYDNNLRLLGRTITFDATLPIEELQSMPATASMMKLSKQAET